MQAKVLFSIGTATIASLATFHLTRGQSLAALQPQASEIGISAAMEVSKKEEASQKHHHHIEEVPHSHDNLESIFASSKQQRRRATRSPLRRILRRTFTPTPTKVGVQPKAALAASIRPVFAQPDIKIKHQKIANETLLNAIPQKCQDTLKNFYVRYDNPKHRGLAGKSVMILDGNRPDKEFQALFIHESAHNVDLGCLTGTQASGRSMFWDEREMVYNDDPSIGFYQISWITAHVQRSNSHPQNFVSGYAAADVYEDFAESFTYFVLHNDKFRARAQKNPTLAKKYLWIRDNLFAGQAPHVATGKSHFTGRVPWDITKLDFDWHPRVDVAQGR